MSNEIMVKQHMLDKHKPTLIISEITEQNLKVIAAVEQYIEEILAGSANQERWYGPN